MNLNIKLIFTADYYNVVHIICSQFVQNVVDKNDFVLRIFRNTHNWCSQSQNLNVNSLKVYTLCLDLADPSHYQHFHCVCVMSWTGQFFLHNNLTYSKSHWFSIYNLSLTKYSRSNLLASIFAEYLMLCG